MEFKYLNVFLPDNIRELVTLIGDENIFKIVFDEISFDKKYLSPFRKEDTRPGCFFWETPDSRLNFVDYADTEETHYDSVAFIQKYFNLEDIGAVANFIREKFKNISSSNFKSIETSTGVSDTPKAIVKKEVKFKLFPRDWNNQDRLFWSPYGITKQQLIEDKVYPLEFFQLIKESDFYTYRAYNIVYAYTDFPDSKVKIYNVYNSDNKWFSNCTKDDIGNINNIDKEGDVLIISKSYKDCRVLRNLDYKNTIWVQNEMNFPNISILVDLCKRFKKIIIFFDNDEPGIRQGKRFSEFINSLYPEKSKSVYLPKGPKDPSDYIKKYQSEKTNLTINKILRNV